MRQAATALLAAILLAGPPAGLAQDPGAIVGEGATLLPARAQLDGLVKVTAADNISFGLRPDGRLVAWGSDALGLLDVVDPAASYLDVSVGYLHVLVLRDDGSIQASSGPDTWFPLTPPEPNSGYAAVSAGSLHSLALRDDGSIESWGSDLPVPAPNAGFTAIAAGAGTMYALRADSTITAWGANTYGQLDIPAPNAGFVAIAAGDDFAVALRADGSVVAWGRGDDGQLVLPTPNSGFTAVAASARHALALRGDGSIAAWGDNTYGQSDVPQPNAGFVSLAAGFDHSVGVRDDGSLVCWGRRETGACGVRPPNEDYIGVDGDLAIRADGSLRLYLEGTEPPGVPAPNAGFVKVQRGGTWNLALRGADGSFAAWGDNYSGQLNVPAPNAGYVDFESGPLHTVALRGDGAVEVWGDNWNGQCDIPEPEAEYIAVAAGNGRSAAVKADRTVSVWGIHAVGPDPGATGYVDVALGRYHTMALHEDGHIDVWTASIVPLGVPEPNSGFVAIHADAKTCVAVREDGTVEAWGSSAWEPGPLFGGDPMPGFVGTDGSTVFAVPSAYPSAVEPDPPTAAAGLVLGAAPNPFNPTLTVWFTAPADDRATIEVYDLRGRRVKRLWSGEIAAGQRRSAVWNGRDDDGMRVASGTYLVKLQGRRAGVATRKVSLVQ